MINTHLFYQYQPLILIHKKDFKLAFDLSVLRSHSFFIPPTTANDLRLRRIFYLRFYPLHLFIHIIAWWGSQTIMLLIMYNNITTGTCAQFFGAIDFFYPFSLTTLKANNTQQNIIKALPSSPNIQNNC